MSRLFVAWRGSDPERGWGPVGRLEFDGGVFRYLYTRGAKTLTGFQPFPGMDDLEQVYESDSLFPLFSNRLLSKSRSPQEYEDFLRWGGFAPNSAPDPIAILGVTEGIRQTDSVEVFPCPLKDVEGRYVNKFFLHGLRWIDPAGTERVARLREGEQLFLQPEPQNASDPNAIAVVTNDRTKIGYVPRYLANDVRELQQASNDFLELFVIRLNRDAPFQHRVLCEMHASWPLDFVPCSTDAFEPIPQIVGFECEA